MCLSSTPKEERAVNDQDAAVRAVQERVGKAEIELIQLATGAHLPGHEHALDRVSKEIEQAERELENLARARGEREG